MSIVDILSATWYPSNLRVSGDVPHFDSQERHVALREWVPMSMTLVGSMSPSLCSNALSQWVAASAVRGKKCQPSWVLAGSKGLPFPTSTPVSPMTSCHTMAQDLFRSRVYWDSKQITSIQTPQDMTGKLGIGNVFPSANDDFVSVMMTFVSVLSLPCWHKLLWSRKLWDQRESNLFERNGSTVDGWIRRSPVGK